MSKKKRKNKSMPRQRARQYNGKLKLWQDRLAKADADFAVEIGKMDKREQIYNGDSKLEPLVNGDTENRTGVGKTSHVRNIVFENIESQISSSIPQPKVTPRRQEEDRKSVV